VIPLSPGPLLWLSYATFDLRSKYYTDHSHELHKQTGHELRRSLGLVWRTVEGILAFTLFAFVEEGGLVGGGDDQVDVQKPSRRHLVHNT